MNHLTNVCHALSLVMVCSVCSLLRDFNIHGKIMQIIIPIEFPGAHKHWPLIGWLSGFFSLVCQEV